MTAKTLEKVPVNLGGFVHPAVDSVYPVDDIPSVAIFSSSDLGAHYDQMNMTAGKLRLIKMSLSIQHLFLVKNVFRL